MFVVDIDGITVDGCWLSYVTVCWGCRGVKKECKEETIIKKEKKIKEITSKRTRAIASIPKSASEAASAHSNS